MILAGFHQEVHKARDKAWHDRHIKRTYFLVYDSKSLQHPGKLRMHWLGPYEVNTVTYGRAVQLKNLGGKKLRGMINGSRLKLYRDSRHPSTSKKKKKNTERLTCQTSKDSNKGVAHRKENEHMHLEMLAQRRKDQQSLKRGNNRKGGYDK
jgi:hypothetical protein